MEQEEELRDSGTWAQIDVSSNCRRLLLAPSRIIAQKMLKDLFEEASRYGLEVHEQKTKIVRTGIGRGPRKKEVLVDGRAFEILASDASTEMTMS